MLPAGSITGVDAELFVNWAGRANEAVWVPDNV